MQPVKNQKFLVFLTSHCAAEMVSFCCREQCAWLPGVWKIAHPRACFHQQESLKNFPTQLSLSRKSFIFNVVGNMSSSGSRGHHGGGHSPQKQVGKVDGDGSKTREEKRLCQHVLDPIEFEFVRGWITSWRRNSSLLQFIVQPWCEREQKDVWSAKQWMRKLALHHNTWTKWKQQVPFHGEMKRQTRSKNETMMKHAFGTVAQFCWGQKETTATSTVSFCFQSSPVMKQHLFICKIISRTQWSLIFVKQLCLCFKLCSQHSDQLLFAMRILDIALFPGDARTESSTTSTRTLLIKMRQHNVNILQTKTFGMRFSALLHFFTPSDEATAQICLEIQKQLAEFSNSAFALHVHFIEFVWKFFGQPVFSLQITF